MGCVPQTPGVCSGEAPALAPYGPTRAAWLVGTPVYVWQVVEGFEHEGSLPALAAKLGLTEHHVQVALEYHERSPEAVERDRRRARRASGGGV